MKRLLLFLLSAAAVGGLIFAFLAGRKELAAERERESPVKAPSRVAVAGDETTVKFDAAERQLGGVETGALAAGRHQPTVRAFGVVVDPQELIDLGGQVETARAQLGKARASAGLAGKNFERAKMLRTGERGVVSMEAFQTTQGAFQVETANAAVAESQMSSLTATARQRWGPALGQAILDDTEAVRRLRRGDDLLLQLTIPSGAALADAPGDATVQGAHGGAHAARFLSASPRTDPKIQGRSFFYVTEAKAAGLLPGMNVEARLPSGEPEEGVIVPGGALVWLHGKAWVYRERAADHFARREVSTGQPEGDGFFQSADFDRDGKFVVKGAQVLLSEEFRAQVELGD